MLRYCGYVFAILNGLNHFTSNFFPIIMAVFARNRVEEGASDDGANKRRGCLLHITVLVGLLSILVIITGEHLHVPTISSFLFTTTTKSNGVAFPDLYEASVAELQAGLYAGHFTSVDLVKVRRYTYSFAHEG